MNYFCKRIRIVLICIEGSGDVASVDRQNKVGQKRFESPQSISGVGLVVKKPLFAKPIESCSFLPGAVPPRFVAQTPPQISRVTAQLSVTKRRALVNIHPQALLSTQEHVSPAVDQFQTTVWQVR